MSFKLEIRGDARIDILNCLDWFLNKSVSTGEKLQIQIEDSINRILKTPFAFEIRYKETRLIHLKNFPISIHYSINEKLKLVTLVAVLSSNENPEKWELR